MLLHMQDVEACENLLRWSDSMRHAPRRCASEPKLGSGWSPYHHENRRAVFRIEYEQACMTLSCCIVLMCIDLRRPWSCCCNSRSRGSECNPIASPVDLLAPTACCTISNVAHTSNHAIERTRSPSHFSALARGGRVSSRCPCLILGSHSPLQRPFLRLRLPRARWPSVAGWL